MVRPSEDMLTVAAAKENLRRSIALPQLPPPMLHFKRAFSQKPGTMLLACLALGVAAGASKRVRNVLLRVLERAIES